jgi:hypothetical protein
VPLGTLASQWADNLGLPTPQNATERVVGDAARFMAGAAGMAGTAGKVAQLAAPGLVQSAADLMAANPSAQIAGAAASGAGSGAVRELGGTPEMQFAAALAGGLAGAHVAGPAADLASSLAARLAPQDIAGNLDQQIAQTLGSAGVDWNEVPPAVQQGVRAQAAQALNAGDSLDPAALSRLVDFQQVGATPTRGTLSLDPVQITQEQNLARAGANSSDTGLQGLAQLQNQNNSTLIDNLNGLGANAADDAYGAGYQAMNALDAGLSRDKFDIDSLYSQARDSAGRSFPWMGSTSPPRPISSWTMRCWAGRCRLRSAST